MYIINLSPLESIQRCFPRMYQRKKPKPNESARIPAENKLADTIELLLKEIRIQKTTWQKEDGWNSWFSLVKDGTNALGKPICASSRLSEISQCWLWNSTHVGLTDHVALSRPFKEEHRALHLSTPLSSGQVVSPDRILSGWLALNTS